MYSTVTELISENCQNLRTAILGGFPEQEVGEPRSAAQKPARRTPTSCSCSWSSCLFAASFELLHCIDTDNNAPSSLGSVASAEWWGIGRPSWPEDHHHARGPRASVARRRTRGAIEHACNLQNPGNATEIGFENEFHRMQNSEFSLSSQNSIQCIHRSPGVTLIFYGAGTVLYDCTVPLLLYCTVQAVPVVQYYSSTVPYCLVRYDCLYRNVLYSLQCTVPYRSTRTILYRYHVHISMNILYHFHCCTVLVPVLLPYWYYINMVLFGKCGSEVVRK